MKMNKKGFTLIELLIVIAIIAILAAIAIPQFAAYRIRAYNTSATTDQHNTTIQEAAMFSDWQRFGMCFSGALPGPGGSGTCATPLTGPGPVPPLVLGITATDNGLNPRGLQLPVGNGVTLLVSTDAVVAPAGSASFTVISKHVQGNTAYAADSDVTTIYKNSMAPYIVTYVLGAGDAILSVPELDDIVALGPNWVKM